MAMGLSSFVYHSRSMAILVVVSSPLALPLAWGELSLKGDRGREGGMGGGEGGRDGGGLEDEAMVNLPMQLMNI